MNTLKRTLIGVGGIRLISHPGVIYPREMLRSRPGMKRKTGVAYAKAPAWGITTREAARLLMCSPTAARQRLHRRKILYHLVKRTDGPPAIYWKFSQVEKLANELHPFLKKPPCKLLDSIEAARLLGLARSALYRYTKKGTLNVFNVRVMTPKRPRNRCFYRRREILQLGADLRKKLEKRLASIPLSSSENSKKRSHHSTD